MKTAFALLLHCLSAGMILTTAPANTAETASPTVAAPTEANAKTAFWYTNMRKTLGVRMCANGLFRKCLDVDDATCLSETQKAFDLCEPIVKAKFPIISSDEVAKKAGGAFGQCVSLSVADKIGKPELLRACNM